MRTLLTVLLLSSLAAAQVMQMATASSGSVSAPPVSNIQLIDSQVCSASAATCTHAVTAAAGDQIVVIQGSYNVTPAVPTNGGDTFVSLYDFAGGSSAGHMAASCLANNTHVNPTVTVKGATYTWGNIRVYRGASCTVDAVSSALTTFTTSQPYTSTLTGTTNDLAIGMCDNYSDATNSSFAVTDNWTNSAPVILAAGAVMFVADILNGVPGSQYTFAMTSSAAKNFACAEVVLKSAVSGTAPSGNFPSMYTGFETGSNGAAISMATLASSTHGMGRGWDSGSFAVGGFTYQTAAVKTLHSQATTNGVTYTDASGAMGLKYDMGTSGGGMRYNLPTGLTSVTVSFFFLFHDNLNTDTSTYSESGILAGSDYVSLSIKANGESPPTISVCMETPSVGCTAYGSLSKDTWYWVTMQQNKGGTHHLKIYETATWTQVYTTDAAATGSNAPVEFSGMGSPEGGGTSTGVYAYQDNILIDYVSGTFPVLP